MELLILFGTFVFLLIIGTPIAFCLGVASFATIMYLGLPPLVVFQRLTAGVSIFVLMAIPFFIYAGDLMVRGGIAARLVAVAGALVGHLRGGLGQVNIAASVLFGGISGSAVADVAATGTVLIPEMKKRGYSRTLAAAITSSSASLAIIIPPSIPMILYGAIAEQIRRRGQAPHIAVLTDGQANIARDGTPGRTAAAEDARAMAQAIRALGLPSLLLDTAPRPRPQAAELAQAMSALYLPLPRADARALKTTLQTAPASKIGRAHV